jgi:hypothetical protein
MIIIHNTSSTREIIIIIPNLSQRKREREMATVFPVGQSAPLYTFTTTVAVIVFMILAQVAGSVFPLYDFQSFATAKDSIESVGRLAKGPYRGPAWISFALVGTAIGILGWWLNDLNVAGTYWGFKVIWVTSSILISSIPILAEIPLRLWFKKSTIRSFMVSVNLDFRHVDKEVTETDSKASVEKYNGFLFAVHYACMATLFTMSFLCLYIFPGQTLTDDINRSVIVAVGAIIAAFLLGDAFFKAAFRENSKRIITAMVDNKRVQPLNLDDLQPKSPPQNYAGLAPVSFARSEGLGFARDIPVNMLAHHIENKLIRPDTKTTLGIKDYQIIQTSPTNAILLSSKDGNALLNAVPEGSLNFERHGMLGEVNTFGKPMVDASEATDPNIKKAKENEDEIQHTKYWMFRIFEDGPLLIPFENYVMGIGKGNGLWINTPQWLSIFLSLYFLAVEMQIWRNEGAGLIAAFITLVPCFVFSQIGHERQYMQLFWLNRLAGYFCILAQRKFPYQNQTNGYTSYYLMNSTLIYDNTTVWLFDSPPPTSANSILSVRFTTWLAFTYVALWASFSIVKFFLRTVPPKGNYSPLKEGEAKGT